MEALLTVSALALAGVLAWALPRWRLRRALARPLAPDELAILESNVEQYRAMSGPERVRLERLVRRFLHEKSFVGCAGLAVTDEMRLTIAGQACLLLLGARGEAVYPTLNAVLIYPGAFLVPRRQVDAAGVVTEERQDLLGESWGDGRVILSWDHVRRAGMQAPPSHTRPHNVVLHEFAHQLDSESGSTNGAPYLGSAERYRSWSEVLSRDFAALRHDAWFGHEDVLDHYGATNPAEFFAVATEAFFEQPHRLAARHPALYEEFLKYYRVDPRAWQAAPAIEAPSEGLVYGQWQ